MVSSLIFLFFLGLAPSLFWLLLFLIEDSKKPEPVAMIAEVFSAGVIAGVVAAILEELAIRYLTLSNWFGMNAAGEFLLFALIEEVVIFLAVYMMVSKKRLRDQHVAAMIYMITAALGFAALENVSYLISVGPTVALQTALIRSVGATLLHAVASGFIGFYWAEGKLWKGIIIATLIHFAFDCMSFFLPQQVYSIAFVLLCSFFIFHDFDILKGEKNVGITKQAE
jgi:RsiW-degrading membrane proteinase PrsW (M82 family)